MSFSAIKQQNENVSWRRRAQIRQLAWPIAEQQVGQWKSRSVLSARFPVVIWRSRCVAKSVAKYCLRQMILTSQLVSAWLFQKIFNFLVCLLGEEHNFLQLSSTEINSRNEPYDYGSIMHYGKSTFAKEVNKVTILPKKDPRTSFIPDIGQRDRLSAGDIRQISKMYRCTGRKMFSKVSP